jgi:hypothetical protein
MLNEHVLLLSKQHNHMTTLSCSKLAQKNACAVSLLLKHAYLTVLIDILIDSSIEGSTIC